MTGIEAYFEALVQRFEDLSDSGGGARTCHHRIADQPVTLRFAEPSLADSLTPALAHLARGEAALPDAPSSLTIMAWDQSGAAGRMPKPPWDWGSYRSRGEIGGLDSDDYRVWYHLDSGVLSIIDLRRGRAVCWIRDSSRLPIYVVAAPFRMILNTWLTRSGLHFAHAAAVGTPAGAVLLGGAGGSGKSTTSLACLHAGMEFLSDDYCIVGARPEPRVHSVYCSAKTDDAMLRRLPRLAGSRQQRDDPPGEKALLLLNDQLGDRIVASRRLVALLAPTVRDQARSSLEPIKGLTALRALAPTTMEQIAGPDAAAWTTLLSLAGRLPCYRLDLGRDLLSAPPLISELIAERVAEGIAGPSGSLP